MSRTGAPCIAVSAPGSELTIPGSGLSLAVARAIAEAHGGSLEVSTDRGGTTATVTVPTHIDERHDPEKEAA